MTWIRVFMFYLVIPCLKVTALPNYNTFLKDFFQRQHIKPQLFAFLCYKDESLIELIKSINTPISFRPFASFEINTKLVNPNNVMFLVDLSCDGSMEFLQNKVEAGYFGHPYRWIMLKNNSLEKLPNVNALPDSNVVIASYSQGGVQLNHIYKISKSSPYYQEPYGTWSDQTGPKPVQTNHILSRRRSNLQGKIFQSSLVVTNDDSVNHLNDYVDRHIDSVAKNSFTIITHLLDALNSSMQFGLVHSWGYKNHTTGEWSGMVGQLVRQEIDIGGTALFLSKDRIHIIEYVSMIVPTVAKFLFREPPLSYVKSITLLPFSKGVWLAKGCMQITMIATIAFLIRFQRKSDGNIRFSDYILNGISSLCQMGIIFSPKSMSSRIATVFLLLSLLFLYTAFTAQIVALLQSTSHNIKSLKDLYDSGLTMAVDENPYNRYYFTTATEPIRKEVYEKRILTANGPRFLNIYEGVSEIRNGFFAFYVELGSAYKLIEETYYEHEKCNLGTISYMDFLGTWMAMQKNSPYKEMIKVNMLKIREHGLQNRENVRIYTKKPSCTTTGQSFGSIRVLDCYTAFVLLAAGYCVTCIVFVAEKVISLKIKSFKKPYMREHIPNKSNWIIRTTQTSILEDMY